MLRELAGGTCDDGKTCPALYQSDRDTVVVRGWVVADPEMLRQLNLRGGADVVEVPAGLLAGADGDWPALRVTGRGTVIVAGTAVRDPETLRHLRLPAGEGAVEVPAGLFPRGRRDAD